MGGIFGGFLSFVDVVGGGILYVLIGSSAWKDNKGARENRLLLGSLVLGVGVGAIYYIVELARDLSDSWYVNLFVAIIMVFVFIGFVFALESIRKRIDEDEE